MPFYQTFGLHFTIRNYHREELSGLIFCMMNPVYISLLILYYPRINLSTLRVISLAGTITIIDPYVFIIGEAFWSNGLVLMAKENK